MVDDGGRGRYEGLVARQPHCIYHLQHTQRYVWGMLYIR